MWLNLVRQRCLKRSIERLPVTMSKAERTKLLDAALTSNAPEAYLGCMQSAFDEAGREDDATMAASLQLLYRAGEIEVLMWMRAEWLGRRAADQSRPARSR